MNNNESYISEINPEGKEIESTVDTNNSIVKKAININKTTKRIKQPTKLTRSKTDKIKNISNQSIKTSSKILQNRRIVKKSDGKLKTNKNNSNYFIKNSDDTQNEVNKIYHPDIKDIETTNNESNLLYRTFNTEKQNQIFISPYQKALELQKFLALPPGTTKDNKKKEKSRPKEKKKILSKKLRMIISTIPNEQIEVGIAENDILLEYYLEMLHQTKYKGNIYKGIIHNIDPNLQAAFVDFGVGKNGFLQIDEIHPEYWQNANEASFEKKKLPPIQKILQPGQEVLVQVVKEPSGNKGAFLTTWLSLAGRFLVLTPGQEQVGVSRKVEDSEERKRLRELVNGLEPGKGLGIIVRTAGAGATKTTLKNDLQYLKRLWKEIRKKGTEVKAPAIIYKEPGLSERSVRDYLTDEITEIWVDDKNEAQNLKVMIEILFPRKKDLVHLYTNNNFKTVWDNFNLKNQLDQIYAREVNLPSGGRIVFDQTEALMAIDINSGKMSGKGNFENMAFKTNMEAAEAIARHLRLRDIGGQIVIDFIEMKEKKHIQEVEKNLKNAMKNDRARHDIAKISSFGLLELVRQRMGSSALSLSMESCDHCGGTGLRRNLEWQALQFLRDLRIKLQNTNSNKHSISLPYELGLYLLNIKRNTLNDLEKEFGISLELKLS